MTEKVKQSQSLSDNLSWRTVKSTVSKRLMNGSLMHTLNMNSKTHERTKLFNEELKKHPPLKTYAEYVKLKTSLLKKFPSNDDTSSSVTQSIDLDKLMPRSKLTTESTSQDQESSEEDKEKIAENKPVSNRSNRKSEDINESQSSSSYESKIKQYILKLSTQKSCNKTCKDVKKNLSFSEHSDQDKAEDKSVDCKKRANKNKIKDSRIDSCEVAKSQTREKQLLTERKKTKNAVKQIIEKMHDSPIANEIEENIDLDDDTFYEEAEKKALEHSGRSETLKLEKSGSFTNVGSRQKDVKMIDSKIINKKFRILDNKQKSVCRKRNRDIEKQNDESEDCLEEKSGTGSEENLAEDSPRELEENMEIEAAGKNEIKSVDFKNDSKSEERVKEETGKVEDFIVKWLSNKKNDAEESPERQNRYLEKKEEQGAELIRKIKKDKENQEILEEDKEYVKKFSIARNDERNQEEEEKRNEFGKEEDGKGEKNPVEKYLNQSTDDIFDISNSKNFDKYDFKNRSRVFLQFLYGEGSVNEDSKQTEEIRLAVENGENNESFFNLAKISENLKIVDKETEEKKLAVQYQEIMSLRRVNQIKGLNLDGSEKISETKSPKKEDKMKKRSEKSPGKEESLKISEKEKLQLSKDRVIKTKQKLIEAKSDSENFEDTKIELPKKEDKKKKKSRKSPRKKELPEKEEENLEISKERVLKSKKKLIEAKSHSSDSEEIKTESPGKTRSISFESKGVDEKSLSKNSLKIFNKNFKEKSSQNSIETEVQNKKDTFFTESSELESYMKDGFIFNKQEEENDKLKEKEKKYEARIKSEQFDGKKTASTSQIIEETESENAESQVISETDVNISVRVEQRNSKRTKKDSEAKNSNYTFFSLRKNNRDQKEVNQKKITQLRNLIEEDLEKNDVPISVSVNEISDNDVIGLLENSKMELLAKWKGKSITFCENKFKISDYFHQISNKKLDIVTCVLNDHKGKTSCKAVNAMPIHSILVQPRNVLKDLDNRPENDKINSHNVNELKNAQKKKRSVPSSHNEYIESDLKVVKKRKLWNVEDFFQTEKPINIIPEKDADYKNRYTYNSSDVEVTDGKKAKKSPLSIIRKKTKKFPVEKEKISNFSEDRRKNLKKSIKEDSDSSTSVNKVKRRNSNTWLVESISDAVQKKESEENNDSKNRKVAKKKLNRTL